MTKISKPNYINFLRLCLWLVVSLAASTGCASAQPREAERSNADCPIVKAGRAFHPGQGGPNEVPSERRAVLARGVNVTNLFSPPVNWPVEKTFRRLRTSGVRHIRIPIGPELFSEPPPEGQVAALQRLDTAVCAAIGLGLGVIIDMHPFRALEPVGGSNDEIAERLALAWQKLAGRYGSVSPELVFFEILNEPKLPDEKEWETRQEAMLHVIRASAPRNTVILTASPWSTAAALSELSPSPDPNVVYTFHFYTPMVFTHQSAEWALPDLGSLHDLAYPARPDNLAVVTQKATPELRPELLDYAKDFADRTAIATEIDLAADWSRRHGRAVIVTEFGVYGRAPRASRAAWLQDVRQAFEQRQIGWTVWEYEGGFGIADDLQQGCRGSGTIADALALCGR